MTMIHFSNAAMVAGAAIPETFVWDGTYTIAESSITNSLHPGIYTQFAVTVDLARISKNRAVVSNRGVTADGNADQGEAHIFKYTGTLWTWEATFTAPVPAISARFGGVVRMGACGDRMITNQTGTTTPAQANVFVYERAGGGTNWALAQTIETSYSSGSATESIVLSEDMDVLILSNNSTAGEAEVWRHNGSAYVFEQTIPGPGGNDNFGKASSVSRDGKVAAFTYPPGGAIHVYEENANVWTQRASIFIGAGTIQSNKIDMNEDGSILQVGGPATSSNFRAFLWDNVSDYNLISDNTPSSSIGGVGSSGEGKIAFAVDGTGALCYSAEGSGTEQYTLTSTQTPTAPEQGSSSVSVANDGYLCLAGNSGWRLANGQQGRAVSFDVTGIDQVKISEYTGGFYIAPAPAVASYTLGSNGVASTNQSPAISAGEWWSAGATVGIGAGYEVFATEIFNSGGVTLGGDSVDVWLSLSTDRTWTVTAATGNGDISLRIMIKNTATGIIVNAGDITVAAIAT